jgi:hypothetical protein
MQFTPPTGLKSIKSPLKNAEKHVCNAVDTDNKKAERINQNAGTVR